jgi:hypothetical protein
LKRGLALTGGVLTHEALAVSEYDARQLYATGDAGHCLSHAIQQLACLVTYAVNGAQSKDWLRASAATELDGRPWSTAQLLEDARAATVLHQLHDASVHNVALHTVLVAPDALVDADLDLVTATECDHPACHIASTRST